MLQPQKQQQQQQRGVREAFWEIEKKSAMTRTHCRLKTIKPNRKPKTNAKKC